MVVQITLIGVSVISLIIILLFCLVIFLLRKLNRRRFECYIWENLPEIMKIGISLKESYKAIFRLIEKVIKTDDAYIYLVDIEGKILVQKASKEELPDREDEEVGILTTSHVGEKVTIKLPRTMPRLDRDEVPDFITQGAARFFSIPLVSSDGFEGVLRIGPIFSKHMKTLKRNKRLLCSLAIPLSLVIKKGLILNKVKEEIVELGALSEIEKEMMRSVFELKEFLELLLGVTIEETGSDGGFILVDQRKGEKIKIFKGIPASVMEEIDSLDSVNEKLTSFNFIVQNMGKSGVVGLIRERTRLAFEENNKRLLIVLANRMELAIKHANSYRMMLDDYLDTLRSLVKSMEAKDPFMEGHAEGIVHYVELIAREMGLGDEETEGIKTAALLHDVGMCALADQILNKPGKYTNYEYETMKNHAQIGAALVEPIKQPFNLAPIIRSHHERYDGWGYPNGLRGKDIPLGARIINLADSFNAMISKRPYRDPLPLEDVIKEIEKASGTQFDPDVIKAFLNVVKKI